MSKPTGPGTSLGDPIEVDALHEVFGQDPRPAAQASHRLGQNEPGAHESASGVAGLIKCVLALQHEEIPRQLHLKTLTPEINWSKMPIEVVSEPIAWPRSAAPRRAGVSSFGFSGGNAHVVLAESPAVPLTANELERPRHLLTLSTRDPQALSELADRYAAALLGQPTASLADFCFTANTGRAAFRHRLAISGTDHEQLAAALSSSGTGPQSSSGKPAALGGQWSGEPLKIALLLPAKDPSISA